MMFALILSLVAVSSAVSSRKQIRSGRFLAFDSDDALLDLLDEMQDPLPRPSDSGYPQVDQVSHIEEQKPSHEEEQTGQKIVFFDPDSGKPEYVQVWTPEPVPVPLPKPKPKPKPEPARFPKPQHLEKPVTENNVFFFGGHTHRYGDPVPSNKTGNKTEEIKIFWSSVGDVVENAPFLPIQINVPDMVSAVATFLANSIPLLQRIRNPNEPRPIADPSAMPSLARIGDPGISEIDAEYRGLEPERKKTKEKEKEKEKEKDRGKSKTKASSKRIFKRPLIRPVPTSTEDLVKIWHGSQSGEAVKYKNMPITRKKFHVIDKEFFNFKNSDISNSPIMILNMPSRPMMYYKIKHHVSTGENAQTPPGPEPIRPNPHPQYQNVTAQISRKKKFKKESKNASKKSARVKNPQKRRQ